MQNSKVKAVDTYFTHANYWAPLTNNNNNDNNNNNIQKEQSKSALTTPQEHRTTVEAFDKNAFCRWLNQWCNIELASKTEGMGMVLDSGATSHFVQLTENLPTKGSSNMTVILPYGKSIKATHTMDLPFECLHPRARHAHVLPHLKTHSLISVPKLVDAGYMTVFHPENLGVTIHSKSDISIQQWYKPVLQGWRDGNGLWKLGYNDVSSMSKQQNNSIEHNLPDIISKKKLRQTCMLSLPLRVP
jgi:hypothetical protein